MDLYEEAKRCLSKVSEAASTLAGQRRPSGQLDRLSVGFVRQHRPHGRGHL
jgi:hypothetical protein